MTRVTAVDAFIQIMITFSYQSIHPDNNHPSIFIHSSRSAEETEQAKGAEVRLERKDMIDV